MKLFRFIQRSGGPSLCCSGVDRGDTAAPGDVVILTDTDAKTVAKSMSEALVPITGADIKTVCRVCGVRSIKDLAKLSHASVQAMCRKAVREAEAAEAEEARIVAAVNATREETTTEATTEAQPSE